MKQKRKRAKNPRIRSDGYAKDVVYSLDIDCIRANSAQPRKDFEIESIIKLADSIRRYGILQPLTVRRVREEDETSKRKKRNLVADLLAAGNQNETPAKTADASEEIWDGIYVSRETSKSEPLQLRIPDKVPYLGSSFEEMRETFVQAGELSAESTPGKPQSKQEPRLSVFVPSDTQVYELVAGERRLRAAKMLGLREVPCVIMDVTDALAAELALVENLLRENLNMFEQAEAFARLAEQYSLTQEEIAAKMSLSQSAVANKIRLLKLSPEERAKITESGLTERHARALLRVADETARRACLETIIERKYNVNDAERYITALLESETSAAQAPIPQPPTADKLCANIYRFVSKIQSTAGGYLTVNRKSDRKCVTITLTVRKDS
ncbi:MAG: ParB/RepB/Spo0J family partition protein [Clostridia bacterium]|nr:ParB/RepB/Spo0J family partition protein [Clostridia bacterium]